MAPNTTSVIEDINLPRRATVSKVVAAGGRNQVDLVQVNPFVGTSLRTRRGPVIVELET